MEEKQQLYCDMLPLLVPISHITGMRPKATVASKMKAAQFGLTQLTRQTDLKTHIDNNFSLN